MGCLAMGKTGSGQWHARRPTCEVTWVGDYYRTPDSLRILRACQALDQAGPTPERITAAWARAT
jgi:hypothetical protein